MNEQNNGYQPPQGNGYPPHGYSQQGQGYPQQDPEYYQQPNGPYRGQPYYQQPYIQAHQPQKKTSPLVKGCGIGCAGLIGIIVLFALLPSTDNDDDVDTYTPPETATTTIAAVDDSDDWFMDSSEPEEDSDERSEDTTTAETTAPPETTTKETTTTQISRYIPSEVSDFSWYGTGDNVLSGLHVEGYAVLRFTHDGESNFIVHAHGADEEGLVNEIGQYSGSVLLSVSGDYDIEIEADGNWTAEAHTLEENDPWFLNGGDTLSGHGDTVTGVFSPCCSKYQITHNGKDNFAVWVYDVTFEDRDLLVNEIGAYSGTVFNDYYGDSFFEIQCDGDWTITPID